MPKTLNMKTMNSAEKNGGLIVVLFSYNRAMQLDYTLRMLFTNLCGDRLETAVVFHTSGNHTKGYEVLRKEFEPRGVRFLERGPSNSFFIDVLPRLFNIRNLYRYLKYPYLRRNRDNFKALCEYALVSSSCEFASFLTDDSVFFEKQVIGEEIYELIRENPSQRSFRCYVGGNHADAPATLKSEGKFLTWNYYDSEMYNHWAYPFSVDATIYDKHELLNILKPTLYHMPSTLEAFLVSNVRARRLFSIGFSPQRSTMVGVMLNRVQKLVDNKSGKYDPDMLNEYYLKGYRLEPVLPEVDINAIVPREILLRKGDETIRLSDGGVA